MYLTWTSSVKSLHLRYSMSLIHMKTWWPKTCQISCLNRRGSIWSVQNSNPKFMLKPMLTWTLLFKQIHSNTHLYILQIAYIQKGSWYLMPNKTAAYLIGGKQKNQNCKEHWQGYTIFFPSFLQYVSWELINLVTFSALFYNLCHENDLSRP